MKTDDRPSLLKMMLGNALLLSGLYAGVGLVLECGRRFGRGNALFFERATLVLDSLPYRVLEGVGALRPLYEAYYGQQIDRFAVRLVFAAAALAVIFALAFAVGGVTGLLRAIFGKSRAGRSRAG